MSRAPNINLLYGTFEEKIAAVRAFEKEGTGWVESVQGEKGMPKMDEAAAERALLYLGVWRDHLQARWQEPFLCPSSNGEICCEFWSKTPGSKRKMTVYFEEEGSNEEGDIFIILVDHKPIEHGQDMTDRTIEYFDEFYPLWTWMEEREEVSI